MKTGSRRYFILAVIWCLLSLIWFFRMNEPVVGCIWLAGGIVQMIAGIVILVREKKGGRPV